MGGVVRAVEMAGEVAEAGVDAAEEGVELRVEREEGRCEEVAIFSVPIQGSTAAPCGINGSVDAGLLEVEEGRDGVDESGYGRRAEQLWIEPKRGVEAWGRSGGWRAAGDGREERGSNGGDLWAVE